MNEKEKRLFFCLCDFLHADREEIRSLLHEGATPHVLGQLFFNRMQAVAYGTLKKHNLLGKVNREFRNCLKSAYMQNLEKNKSFFECVQYIEDILSSCQCKYALLKGAYLCKYYPGGFRTSNDIDLLVDPRDVTEIGKALTKAGFKQGNIRNDKFEPATRKEIIESKDRRKAGITAPPNGLYLKSVEY